jgi:hypothetical protein
MSCMVAPDPDPAMWIIAIESGRNSPFETTVQWPMAGGLRSDRNRRKDDPGVRLWSEASARSGLATNIWHVLAQTGPSQTCRRSSMRHRSTARRGAARGRQACVGAAGWAVGGAGNPDAAIRSVDGRDGGQARTLPRPCPNPESIQRAFPAVLPFPDRERGAAASLYLSEGTVCPQRTRL